MADVARVAQAKLSQSTRNLVPRELRRLERILQPDEQLLTLAQGRLDDGLGILAATDQRLIFLGRQLVIEERMFRAQGLQLHYAEIATAGKLRPLSGEIEIRQGRKRTVISEILPRERALEIAEPAGQQRAAQRSRKRAPAPLRAPVARPAFGFAE